MTKEEIKKLEELSKNLTAKKNVNSVKEPLSMGYIR